VCGLPTAKTIQLSAEASENSSLAKRQNLSFFTKKKKIKKRPSPTR